VTDLGTSLTNPPHSGLNNNGSRRGKIACPTSIPTWWFATYNVEFEAAIEESIRDGHHPVCRLDIRQDNEFATGQWRSNPLATLAIASGGTFQGAAKSIRLL